MNTGSTPEKIKPDFRTKIWGSPRIEPWFDARGDKLIGEVWFPAGDLLIKFLFTTAHLSVQVHPDDDYARVHENSRGKTEMWHILRAEPGAKIALGFRHPISAEQLITSSKSGKILDLLHWIEVSPGDTYFVPARTVHAIGEGIALCEIQQNSDITYRLYDFGRDRPLHLKQAAEIADLGPHPGISVPRNMGDRGRCLVESPYFRTFDAVVKGPEKFEGPLGCRFLIVLEGGGLVNGLPATHGQVLDNGGSREWSVEPERLRSPGYMKLLLTE